MKRFFSCITLFLLFSLFSGCAKKTDTRDINVFLNSFQQAGFEVTDIATPDVSNVDAKNGIMFTINGNELVVYEYETAVSAKRAIHDYAILKYSPTNGRFTVATTDGELMEFFATIR